MVPFSETKVPNTVEQKKQMVAEILRLADSVNIIILNLFRSTISVEAARASIKNLLERNKLDPSNSTFTSYYQVFYSRLRIAPLLQNTPNLVDTVTQEQYDTISCSTHDTYVLSNVVKVQPQQYFFPSLMP